MKRKFISILLCFVIAIALTACKSEEVKNVETLIDEIGEVSLESEDKIKEAQDAYDALSNEDKKEVENHDDLLKAETTLDSEKETANQEAYEKAIEYYDEYDYSSALSEFNKIDTSNYKDSNEKKTICEKKVANPFYGTWQDKMYGYQLQFASDTEARMSQSTLNEYYKVKCTRKTESDGTEKVTVEYNSGGSDTFTYNESYIISDKGAKFYYMENLKVSE